MDVRILVPILALLGCADAPPPEAPPPEPPVDADQDGFDVESDCDDANPRVFPGAEERCNGVDDDCDGTVDVGAVDAVDWFADADEDGFGAGEVVRTACDAEAGFSLVDTDCDDHDPDVSPGHEEVSRCDGRDQDCDGAPEGRVWTDEAAWDSLTRAVVESEPMTPLFVCEGEHWLVGTMGDLDLRGVGAEAVVVDVVGAALSGDLRLSGMRVLDSGREVALQGTFGELQLKGVILDGKGGEGPDVVDASADRVVWDDVTVLGTGDGRGVGNVVLTPGGVAELRELRVVDVGFLFLTGGSSVVVDGLTMEDSHVTVARAGEPLAVDLREVAIVASRPTPLQLSVVSLEGAVDIEGVEKSGGGQAAVRVTAGAARVSDVHGREGLLSVLVSRSTNAVLQEADGLTEVELRSDGDASIWGVQAQELRAFAEADIAIDQLTVDDLWTISQQATEVDNATLGRDAKLAGGSSVRIRHATSSGSLRVGAGALAFVDEFEGTTLAAIEAYQVELHDITMARPGTLGGDLYVRASSRFVGTDITIDAGNDYGLYVWGSGGPLTGGVENLEITSAGDKGLWVQAYEAKGFTVDESDIDVPGGTPLILEGPGTWEVVGGLLQGAGPIRLDGVDSVRFDAVDHSIGAPDCAVLMDGCHDVASPASVTCADGRCE